jgi:hypothetical protein
MLPHMLYLHISLGVSIFMAYKMFTPYFIEDARKIGHRSNDWLLCENNPSQNELSISWLHLRGSHDINLLKNLPNLGRIIHTTNAASHVSSNFI